MQRQASASIVIALAGNKADLSQRRTVDTAEAQAYADEHSLLFMETSAKTATNVNDIFSAIAMRLPKLDPNSRADAGGRRLDEENKPSSSPGCCKS